LVTPALASGTGGSNRFGRVDDAIQSAINTGQAPGAVVCVGRKSGAAYLRSYGRRAIQPEPLSMTDDTVFDLASLTKPLASATVVMVLAERGKLAVADRVATYLPAFAANGKGDVTVEQLLLHRGGLAADNPMSDFKGVTREQAVHNILESTLSYPPGTKMIYSDLGFMAVGELVRVVSRRPLNEFCRDEIYRPLGMTDTTYLPFNELKRRCAPTEKRNGRWVIGEVHDPRAFALGGVAGHAGLFGTARDVARYCRMLLSGGELDGVRILKHTTVAEMTSPRSLPDGTGTRAYGFDVDTAYSSPRGEQFTKGKSFGHTGFTGTSMWIDPDHDVFVILLTNAVHPDGKGKVIQLRREVGTAVGDAMIPRSGRETASDRRAVTR
jgi:serine-type D-Ala-D-Ala carboxypeptidase